MSTEFDKPLSGFAFVETHHGDTLQRIAARALGDAALWWQLISPNGLVPPYITDDVSQAGSGVLLTGQPILVPAPSAAAQTTDSKEVFGTDVALRNGLLQASESGDFAFVTGVDNLKQAVKNRLETEQGDLIYHMSYGSILRSLIGTGATPAAELLAASSTKATLLQDPRIDSVTSAKATISGDTASVDVEVQPVMGQSVTVSV
ncbi:hypothetical protein AWB80_07560 [Caballeronia pedi]|uniref:Uncharacterized protein n=1 Tax=Caballeronia pedi TaxID=1777141 RepID=A0A158DVL2_9BURK|nr:DUF2634 domain-containing protein [Caballeronia pedi]SAK98618.1 hypothetical protein AWB80_07560 [Caballeronia pedi]